MKPIQSSDNVGEAKAAGAKQTKAGRMDEGQLRRVSPHLSIFSGSDTAPAALCRSWPAYHTRHGQLL